MKAINLGVSLLEVLISLFILSFILLGLDAMEITALRDCRVAYYFTIATQQIQNIHERLYALKDKQSFSEQIDVWNKQNQELLPNGRGEVTGKYPAFTATIFWGQINSCHQISIGQSGCLQEKIII